VLGVSDRAVRGRLVRGALAGRKVDGKWVVARSALPLDGPAQAAADARATRVRDTVDRALAARADRGVRSVGDLTAFRVCQAALVDAPEPVRGDLREAALHLSIAWHEFNPAPRLHALTIARAALARAVAGLLLHQPPAEVLARRLEAEALPALVGLFRRAERRS
jgi:hypothetical protein